MPFLSVIIPIYNVELYLSRCIESVLNQSFKDLEMILVDDGSPDKCPTICDEYAKRDERVKVIHKKNGGLSSARNAGIEIAVGEYLTFLDSDDAWAEDKLKDIIIKLKENPADFLAFSSCGILENGKVYASGDNIFSKNECGLYKKEEYYAALIEKGNLCESACTKILDASFLKKNGLFFQPDLISEDTEWMFRVLRVCTHVLVTNTNLFVCTFGREGSISNTVSQKSIESLFKIIQQSVEYCKDKEDSFLQYELKHCAYLFSVALGLYSNLGKEHKQILKEEIFKYKYLLKLNTSKKTRLVRFCLTFLGVELTSKLLNAYIKGRKKRREKGK